MVTAAARARKHDPSELVDPAWEKQPWESMTAYNRFRLYRDMPKRSQQAVAAHFGTSDDNIHKIANRNLWAERAERFDAHLDTLGLAMTERQVQNDAAKTAARAAEIAESEWEVWQAAKPAILSLLNQAAGGDPKAAGGAAQLIREADRMVRVAAGLPTEGRRPKDGEGDGRQADLDAFLESLVGEHDPA